ncbi:MAG: aspartate aminotransferase family protein [Ardenticatenales bacterium]|nr:aspartate aminotransferase family protein [Ardenticatenales bacterium]
MAWRTRFRRRICTGYRRCPRQPAGRFLRRRTRSQNPELGPERVAGFVFEPVVGASMGVMPAPEGYAQRMRAICDRYGVLAIADEVMCGCGRTGPWRALEHDGVQPDLMMAIAKGLGGGCVPLGATMFTEQVGYSCPRCAR